MTSTVISSFSATTQRNGNCRVHSAIVVFAVMTSIALSSCTTPIQPGSQLSPHTYTRAQSPDAPVDDVAGVARTPRSAMRTSFTPAEPRLPATPFGYTIVAGTWREIDPRAITDFPDEYLFDGGDREHPYHYEGEMRAGLNTEDAVVEYSDDQGHERVRPTNRVAVYAPRFGAVRNISSAESEFNVAHLGGAKATAPGATLLADVGPVMHESRDAVDGIRVRSRASGFGAETTPVDIARKTNLFIDVKLNNVFENLTFTKSGLLLQNEQARLAYGIQAAREWSQNRYPVMMAEAEGTETLEAWSKPLVMVGSEDMRTPGELRIVKLTDKKVALPGDVITFTIRYDNVGDRELRDIRIIDNLTPRLEYIADSANSERPAQLIVADNQEGSIIITFELTQPLPGKQGGVVTFKTRVR